MTKGPVAKTCASALGVALVGLLFLSPAAGFITSFSGTAEELPILNSSLGGGSAQAQMVPGPPGTAYVANELSGTISVIDTATSTILKTICLGSDPAILGTPQPAGPCNAETQHHNPFYNGHVGTHGLWLTPDGRVLLVANRISGTIVAIDTAAVFTPPSPEHPNPAVIGYQPVGREPHLATVRPPGGREAWVAVRGENYIDVLRLDRERLFDPGLLDTQRMRSRDFLPTLNGPSMVSFTPDGRFGFVAFGKAGLVQKIDAEERKTVASQVVPFPFTPFGLVTPDGSELYLIHKLGAGPGLSSLTVLRTADLSRVVDAMPLSLVPPNPTGDCGNHVAFVGKFAYITMGGSRPCAPGGVDREGKIVIFNRETHTIARELTGPAFTGDPHGIWPTPDGSRLFIGHERGNRITVLGTGNPNDAMDDVVFGTVTGSPADMAFVKQPIDVVIAGPVGVFDAAARPGERRGQGRN